MNELTKERYMTTKELADTLNVEKTTITRAVEKLNAVLHRVKKNNQGGYLLNEEQATLIKQEISKHHNIRNQNNLLEISNDLEAALLSKNLIIYLNDRISRLQEENETQKRQLTEQEPKVEFYDAVADSKDAIDIGTAAKVLNMGIGRNRLFEILRSRKILMNDNRAYQKYIDYGYFRTVETKFSRPDGSQCIFIKTLVYQKGLNFIRRIVKEEIGGKHAYTDK